MIKLCLSVQPEACELMARSDEYSLSVIAAEVVSVGGDPYAGEYTVDPDFTGHTLPTKNKLLLENVVVNPIEVTSVSNTSGGKTVYIGGIFNG